MAARVRRLAGTLQTAANAGSPDLYTVPAGKCAVLRSYLYALETASSGVYKVAVRTAAGNPGNTGVPTAYLWGGQVPSNSGVTVPLGLVLYAGDSFYVETSAAPAYHLFQGVEFDAPASALGLHRVVLTDVTTTAKTYTVPAGKRFRVREVTYSKYSSTAAGLAVVAVNSVGYLLRKVTAATTEDFQVISTDISVNAGEVISASLSGGGAMHAWLSGTLEDV